jgi:hypothetical protein
MSSLPSTLTSAGGGLESSHHHDDQCHDLVVTNTAPMSPLASSSTPSAEGGSPASRSDSTETKLVLPLKGGAPACDGAAGDKPGASNWVKEPPKKKQRIARKAGATKAGPSPAEGGPSPGHSSVPPGGQATSSPSSIMMSKHRQGHSCKAQNNRRRRRRNISWDDSKNQVFLHPNPQATFRDYRETDIWYTVR